MFLLLMEQMSFAKRLPDEDVGCGNGADVFCKESARLPDEDVCCAAHRV